MCWLGAFAFAAVIGFPVAVANARLRFHDVAQPANERSLGELRGVPTAVVVWKASCAPCLVELAHLHEIAARAAGWRIVTLALDDARVAANALPPQARVAAAWYTSDPPAQVLAALNPAQPELPLTIAVSTRGEICARRVGLLGSDVLNAWSARCSR